MFYSKIPRYMKDGHIRLRPLRITDGPFLSDGFRNKDILLANGLSKPLSSSWFFIWWWIKKNFTLSYCIESGSKRIGFIGLYNLMLGKSAEMALIIFDKNDRRLGYGTEAFNIFSQNLRRYSVVKKIIVRIIVDNYAAIYFWKKVGFEELYILDSIKIMFTDLIYDCS